MCNLEQTNAHFYFDTARFFLFQSLIKKIKTTPETLPIINQTDIARNEKIAEDCSLEKKKGGKTLLNVARLSQSA